MAGFTRGRRNLLKAAGAAPVLGVVAEAQPGRERPAGDDHHPARRPGRDVDAGAMGGGRAGKSAHRQGRERSRRIARRAERSRSRPMLPCPPKASGWRPPGAASPSTPPIARLCLCPAGTGGAGWKFRHRSARRPHRRRVENAAAAPAASPTPHLQRRSAMTSPGSGTAISRTRSYLDLRLAASWPLQPLRGPDPGPGL